MSVPHRPTQPLSSSAGRAPNRTAVDPYEYYNYHPESARPPLRTASEMMPSHSVFARQQADALAYGLPPDVMYGSRQAPSDAMYGPRQASHTEMAYSPEAYYGASRAATSTNAEYKRALNNFHAAADRLGQTRAAVNRAAMPTASDFPSPLFPRSARTPLPY